MTETSGKQLLHLVFGGELEDIDSYDFKDLSKLDIVGIFPELRQRACGLESQGAGDGGQCADALLRRPPASLAEPASLKPRATDVFWQADHPFARRAGSDRLPLRALFDVGPTNEPLRHRAAESLRAHRPRNAGDRRHVAWSAPHDPFRQAAGRQGSKPGFALRRRGIQRYRLAPSRHQSHSRFWRARVATSARKAAPRPCAACSARWATAKWW